MQSSDHSRHSLLVLRFVLRYNYRKSFPSWTSGTLEAWTISSIILRCLSDFSLASVFFFVLFP